MSQLKGVSSFTGLVGGLGPRAEFGDGLSVKFLKLLNRRQSLLIVKLLKKVKMKYFFGWLAGNVNFYKEEVLIQFFSKEASSKTSGFTVKNVVLILPLHLTNSVGIGEFQSYSKSDST